ncbi:MAG: hypothetical protein ACQERN_04720 [Thermodesulfobacteriota bacterium]
MGVFDLPAPLLSWADSGLAAFLPPLARLALWGVIGAVISMLLYRGLSAQKAIASNKQQLLAARRRLDAFAGPFRDAWPLISRLLKLAVWQVGRVGWPAVVASLPLLAMLGWLSTDYGYGYPAADVVPQIQTKPGRLHAEWLNGPKDSLCPRIVITDNSSEIIANIVLSAPVPVIHKRQWWNVLIGNPAGYLPKDAAVKRIRVALPRKDYLPFGPDWMRGWETGFFLPLIVASIALKVIARIE